MVVGAQHLVASGVNHGEGRVDDGAVALAVDVLDVAAGRVFAASRERTRKAPLLTHPEVALLLAVGGLAEIVVGIGGDHGRHRHRPGVETGTVEFQTLEVVVDEAGTDDESLLRQFLPDPRFG